MTKQGEQIKELMEQLQQQSQLRNSLVLPPFKASDQPSERHSSSSRRERDLHDNYSDRSHVSQQERIIRKYASYNQNLQKQITDQNTLIDNLVTKVKQTQDESNKNVKSMVQFGCVSILSYAALSEAWTQGAF